MIRQAALSLLLGQEQTRAQLEQSVATEHVAKEHAVWLESTLDLDCL